MASVLEELDQALRRFIREYWVKCEFLGVPDPGYPGAVTRVLEETIDGETIIFECRILEFKPRVEMPVSKK